MQFDEKHLTKLTTSHQFSKGVSWRLTRRGISVKGRPPEVWGGEPITVARILRDHGQAIQRAVDLFHVPVELIVATIATESSGHSGTERLEPGYVSDEETPHRISVGLMQTLVSTAREAMQCPTIDREWLRDDANGILAGTAYIARQRRRTRLDPPCVAAAYNAGGLYLNDSADNRWRMRQYPVGTSKHVDRFVKWFNEAFVLFWRDDNAPELSYFRILEGTA